MNYYIDFDNTLYETAKLTVLMLDEIVNSISKATGKEKSDIDFIKSEFNSTKDNIFSFAEEMSKKFNVNSEKVLEDIKYIIRNSEDITFKDAKRFVKKLKENGHRTTILTYIPSPNNAEYQMEKIKGSGIEKYFDDIIITSEYKFTLDLDYENSIFIDDDPRDLNGLYAKKPIKVIRIRKKNNKRSVIDIENKDIEEYEFFDEIEIPKEI